MAAKPSERKQFIGLTTGGVDDNGEWILFGFRYGNSENLLLEMQHAQLAHMIGGLQSLAHDAQRRRIERRPGGADMEAQKIESNLLASVAVDVDVTGQVARLHGTTTAGTPVDVQMPYEAVKAILKEMPGVLSDMEKRKDSHRNKQ